MSSLESWRFLGGDPDFCSLAQAGLYHSAVAMIH